MPEPESENTWTWGRAELREDPIRGWFVKVDGTKIVEIEPGKGKYWSKRSTVVAILNARGLRVGRDGWITLRGK